MCGAVFVCTEGLTCGMELQRTEQQNRTVVLNDVSISCKEICLTFYSFFLLFKYVVKSMHSAILGRLNGADITKWPENFNVYIISS